MTIPYHGPFLLANLLDLTVIMVLADGETIRQVWVLWERMSIRTHDYDRL